MNEIDQDAEQPSGGSINLTSNKTKEKQDGYPYESAEQPAGSIIKSSPIKTAAQGKDYSLLLDILSEHIECLQNSLKELNKKMALDRAQDEKKLNSITSVRKKR